MKLRTTGATIIGMTLVLMTGCTLQNPFSNETEIQKNQLESGANESENKKEDQKEPENPDGESSNLPSLEDTITVTADGKKVITNVRDPLVLVNKERNLPVDFVPTKLTVPNVPFTTDKDVPKKKLQKVAATALENMFSQAKSDQIPLFAQSGYRSYDRQEAIFASNVQQDGREKANKYSAHPGQSEHQSGLAMDVTSPEVGYRLEEAFGDTKTGKWVKQNAHKFGFIVRYPKGKEGITGYQYEPWHIRYVGVEHARRIHQQNITLEEYLGVKVEEVNASK